MCLPPQHLAIPHLKTAKYHRKRALLLFVVHIPCRLIFSCIFIQQSETLPAKAVCEQLISLVPSLTSTARQRQEAASVKINPLDMFFSTPHLQREPAELGRPGSF